MARIISYLLSEDLADDAENLASKLRKAFGVSSKEIRQMYKDAGQKTEPFYQLLKKKNAELEAQAGSDDLDSGEAPEFRVANREPEELDPKMVSASSDGGVKDEAVIDVLKYLAHLWRSRDRVRVLAARFGLDPDIYAAAGLGDIPEDYNDEDIWNTMDQSNNGKKKFYQSAWQPYYMDTLERLQDLPAEVKQEIADIVQGHKETKRDVHFPTRTDKPFDDTGTAYEAKLAESLVLDSGENTVIFGKGTKIRVI